MILLNPEAQPKVTDFTVWNREGDYTQEIFEGARLLVLIQNVPKANTKAIRRINELIESLKETPVEPLILTASDEVTFEAFRHEHQLAIPYYFADATVLKTMIRSNPGLMLMQNGTILAKWPAASVPEADEVQALVRNSQ
jgi:hypothetical protein